VCWLGTNCGQSIILSARDIRASLRCSGQRAFIAAWAWQNTRHVGVDHGFRSIEHLLARPSDFGRPFFTLPGLGKQLMRRPRLSIDDYECVDHLVEWLGSEQGASLIAGAERRIEEIHRFERATKLAEHKAQLAQRQGGTP
jgi:hypothetical protein